MSQTIPFTIHDAQNGAALSGRIDIDDRGIDIFLDGYGHATAAPGYGSPVFVEFHCGRPRVHCWPSINDEAPTTIELDGAAEAIHIQESEATP